MSRLFKLGTGASRINIHSSHVEKVLHLRNRSEYDAIIKGVELLGELIPSSIHRPDSIQYSDCNNQGTLLGILKYSQAVLSPWLFSESITGQQLYELGRLILDQQKILVGHGLTLIDARPDNYWLYDSPRLVDLGSIKKLDRQNIASFKTDFVNNILNPLLLERDLSIPVGKYYQGKLDRCEIDLLRITSTMRSRSLMAFSIKQRISNLASQIISNSNPEFINYLLSNGNSQGDLKSLTAKGLRVVKKLQKFLTYFKPKLGHKSAWSEYTDFHDEQYTAKKLEAISAFISSLPAESRVVDLGSNLSSLNLSGVDAFIDRDITVCNELRKRAQTNQVVICTDIAEELLNVAQSPHLSSLNLSGYANSAIATSLVHHIIIDAGLPEECFYLSLSRLYKQVLLEFISEDDPMIRLLQAKKGEFIRWTWPRQSKICSKWFTITDRIELSSTRFIVQLSNKQI